MRALLVAALLAGCHHAPPARAPAPAVTATAQPAVHRGPGRADVDLASPAMPLAETVSTSRPCVEPVSDPQPAVPSGPVRGTPLYVLRGGGGCHPTAVTGSGRRRVSSL
jgi:hypothetical protein